jgi:hypothetical protein
MTVRIAEERSLSVRPDQIVKTEWIDINSCILGCRIMMSPEAVIEKFRRFLNVGDNSPWPPVVGHWQGARFVVMDGRHEYLAALMIGREKLFVCWLEES